MEEKKDKIKQFIKDNNIELSGEGSGLNGACTILSGYALHIGITTSGDFIDCIPRETLTNVIVDELDRVFCYALHHNYEKYWESEKAHETYKF